MVIANLDADESTTNHYNQMFLWSENLFSDTFS